MMKFPKYSLLIIILYVFFIWSGEKISAQNKKIDSLRTILINYKEDTNRIKTINVLAWEFRNSKTDTAIILNTNALFLSQKLNWKKGEAIAERQIGWYNYLNGNYELAVNHYNKSLAICESLILSSNNAIVKLGKAIKGRVLANIGVVFYSQANYPKALDYYSNGLKISEQVNDKQQVASAFNNMGTAYYSQSNFPKALECYLKSLKINEEIGDKKQIGILFGNIAALYIDQANYTKALEYFFKDLKIAENLGDKKSSAITLGNIGAVYKSMGNNTKSLECFFKSLKIVEEFDEKRVIASTLYNIGIIYNDLGNRNKAMEYLLQSLKIAEEIGDKKQTAVTLGNIGEFKLGLGLYKEAEGYLKKSLITLNEIGYLISEKDNEKLLSDVYNKTNRPALALEHYKKHIALRDTIYNKENSKKILQSEMNFEFDKKEAVATAEHKSELEKQKAVAEEKNHKQQIIILSVVFGLVLVIVFAAFVFKSLRTTRKQKLIIELKNNETELQKRIIEEKQEEILASIHYAKRIQTALLPNEKYIDKSLIRLNKKV